jgi:hypothetical protein
MKRSKFPYLKKINDQIKEILDKREDISVIDQVCFNVLFRDLEDNMKELRKISSVPAIQDFLDQENADLENPEARQKFDRLCDSFESLGIMDLERYKITN